MESYNIVPTGKNTIFINGTEKMSIVLDTKEGKVINRINHGLEGTNMITWGIYNMIDYKGNQLYFLKNGKITLFKGEARLLEYEEKWLSQIESKITSDGIIVIISYWKLLKGCSTIW